MSQRHPAVRGVAEQAWGIALASVAINVLALAFPLLMLQLYDRIIPTQSFSTLGIFVAAVLLAGLTEASLRYCRSYLSLWSSAKFEHGAMKALVARFLGEPLHAYELKGTGALTQIFRSISLLKSHQSGQTFQQFLDLPFSVFYIAIVFAMNAAMGVALLAGVLIFTALVFGLNKGFPESIAASQEADLRRGNFLNETLRYVHTVKSMTMEALMLRRHDRLQGQCAKTVTDLTITIERGNVMGVLFMATSSIVLVSLGAWLVMAHRLSSGELAACLMLGVRALSPVQRLGQIWTRYQQDTRHKQVLMKALEGPALASVASVENPVVAQPLGLRVQGLGYAFPRSEHNNVGPIDLLISPGECVCLDVPSGKGRTTVMQLLAGILPPAVGAVSYLRGPLAPGAMAQEASDAPHGAVAYVSNQAQFFEGTLLENISRFDEKNVPKALAFAMQTGLADFVAYLPKGWDTPVGHAVSDTLPQAYRQRLSILCALFKQPSMVFLDDPAATLDEAGEALLLRHLDTIKGNTTLVIASDRPAWRALASRHLTLKGVINVAEDTPSSAPSPFASPFGSPAKAVLDPAERGALGDDKWQAMASALAAQFRRESAYADVLLVLLKALQVSHTPRELAESLPYFYDELSFQQMLDTLARLGIEARATPQSAALLQRMALPCLVLPGQGAPYVIKAREPARYLIESQVGQARWVSEDFIRGDMFGFHKMSELSLKHPNWVGHSLTQFKPHFYLAVLGALGAGILSAVSPLLTMQIYSSIIPSGSLDSLLTLLLGAFLALGLTYMFMRQRIEVLGYVAGRIEFVFGTAIFEKILRISPALTEGASVGSQMARLRSFEAIRDFFTTPLASTLLELPVSLVFLGLLAWVNPWSVLVFLLAASLYVLLYWMQFQSTALATKKLMKAVTERNRFLNEFLSNMRAIRCMHGESEWMNRFVHLCAHATMMNFEVEKRAALSVSISNFIMLFSALGVVAVSTPLVINQSLSSGALIASMFLIWRVLFPLQTLYTSITRIERIRSAVTQINRLMNIENEAQSSAMVRHLNQVQGDVRFARVAYRYAGATDAALAGLALHIRARQMVCLSGAHGGGKTTALKLLLRMVPVQSGSIYLDGVDIRQHTPSDLRRLIGYAPQEVQFFRATIVQNLRLARPDASDEAIEQVLKKLKAWDDVRALKAGLHTRLGDNTQVLGSMLMQKLHLARAFITDAPVLILDEPCTHLDEEGVQALVALLNEVRVHKTLLVATQNHALLRMSDQIALLDGGVLRLTGTPQDVLTHARAPTDTFSH